MARLSVVLSLGLGLAGAADGPARAAALLPAYFGPYAARKVAPVMFVRQNPPPPDRDSNASNYAFGPITDSAAMNIAAQNASTWTGGGNWVFLWANRARALPGHHIDAPNSIFPPITNAKGAPYAAEFSTVAKAEAVTTAQVLYVSGAARSVWLAPLLAAGMSAADAIPWAKASANPGAYFTALSQDGHSKVTLDKMIIPYAVSTVARGILVDWEVQDDRSAVETTAYLRTLGATIRGRGLKAYLYTNPWEDPSSIRDGLSFLGIDTIKANWDYLSLYIWGSPYHCDFATSYPFGVNFLKGVSGKLNFSQVIMTVDMKLCSHQTALAMHNQQAIDHFAGYNLFPDGADEGGPTLTGSNLVVNGLLNGQ